MRVPQTTRELILAQGGLPDSEPHQLQEMLMLLASDLRDALNPTVGQHTVYSIMRKALFDALNSQLQPAALVLKELAIESGRSPEVMVRAGVESTNGLWGSIKSFHAGRLITSVAEEFVNDYASARLKAKHLLDEPFIGKP